MAGKLKAPDIAGTRLVGFTVRVWRRSDDDGKPIGWSYRLLDCPGHDGRTTVNDVRESMGDAQTAAYAVITSAGYLPAKNHVFHQDAARSDEWGEVYYFYASALLPKAEG